jgi:hypothetical protein
VISDDELLRHSFALRDLVEKVRADGKVLLAYSCERFNKSCIEADVEWDALVDAASRYIDFSPVLQAEAERDYPKRANGSLDR